MAQIDFITYSGQLVTTLVAFTTLLWFIGTVVRSYTHMYVGFWNMIPASTAIISKEYYAKVTSRAMLFSNTFGTIVSRMVDALSVYASNAVKALAQYSYTGMWKAMVLMYANKLSSVLASIGLTRKSIKSSTIAKTIKSAKIAKRVKKGKAIKAANKVVNVVKTDTKVKSTTKLAVDAKVNADTKAKAKSIVADKVVKPVKPAKTTKEPKPKVEKAVKQPKVPKAKKATKGV